MKHNIIIYAASFLVGIIAFPLSADSFPDSPSCYKPSKPYQFNSQWEVDNFKDEVARYKRCIADFVQEQEDAVIYHQQAIEDAIDEWNRFVRLELN